MMTTFSRGLALTIVALCATSAAVAKEKKPIDPNKKVCRSETATGSLMPKSTCHTVAEWAQLDAANSAAAQTTLDHATRQGAQQ